MDKLKKNLKKLITKIKTFDYKKYYNQNKVMVVFIITSLINGMLLRFLTIKNYFDIQPALCDLGILIVIGAFGFLIKPKNRFKYYFTFSCIFSIICIVNSMYYTNYLSYASVSLLATSLQVVDVADAVYKNIMEIKDFSYIWQIVAMIFVYISIRKSKVKLENKRNKNGFLNTLITGFLVLGVFVLTLSATDIGRITKQWNRDYIVSKYGIYTYQISDAIFSVTPKITSLFGYDNNYKIFRDYYSEKKETESNKYTNIFEGKNILVIHAESIQQFTMETAFNGLEVTPTLNKLASEGIYFSNFYAQESVGTSSDTEFTFNTSLMPATSGTVAINYWDRDYVTIEKLLKQKGYYTFSMHGNNCAFWNRNLLHQSFGYNKFYCYTNDYEIDETIGLGLSDKSFFKQSIPKLKDINANNKNWYGTMIMLTNHTPFSDIKNNSTYEVDYKYESIDEKTGQKTIKSAPYMEGTVLGDYFKSVNYADAALNQLIEQMDAEGLLDNTIVVIYGDHDAKIKKSEYERFFNYDYKTDSILSSSDENYVEFDDTDYELNRKVPLIIWSKDMDKNYQTEVKEATGMYDVLPTLGNMINISSPYSLGNDIFSTTNNLVVFPDSSWLTNDIYYNSQSGEIFNINNTEETINLSEKLNFVEKNNEIAENKIVVSNAIEVYNLIKQAEEDSLEISKVGE